MASVVREIDGTASMRRILLATMIASATWLSAPTRASSQDCAWPMDVQAMDAAGRQANWTALHEVYRDFDVCDDGVIAVSFSEAVIELLHRDGGDLVLLNDLAATDDGFRTFVLRHIDRMALQSELERVIANLGDCPDGAIQLCQDMREAAEQALVTPPWGDGPHRCNREMAFRAEGIAGSPADWDALIEVYQIYHVCDDGAIGAGFSYAVIRLLTKNGGDLVTLNNLTEADGGFRTFVLRHINELAYRSELEPVIENAIACPRGVAPLCKDIKEAAEDAITRAEDL